ncbi:hypothetical protein ABIC86_003643 [Paenibacillus sp. DS2363]|uniref:HTH domain-containing protein n=1 Tax=Paenibacillus TaxID=44249 RepID=UPI001C8DCA7B|nr:HTH domain-containing protein [Paenibacillus xylanexedens]MBY0115769.1 hypothetical protein [Paenibacillus xylanexedens]MCP1423746.1 hypothetical protein [Paenibacillus xylanexedens]
MSKGFSEVEQLSVNLYVKSVSTKGIAYTDEFKQIFIASNQQGQLPRETFESCGFDVQIIDMTRINAAADQRRASYQEQGEQELTTLIQIFRRQ